VTVARSNGAAPSVFEVERFPAMVALDLLFAIQSRHDPALGFRYSCRVAMCGTCTVRMDGRAVLACQTLVDPEADEVLLEPMEGLPVVRDLIVDMAPFLDDWESVRPYFTPAPGLDAPARIPHDAPERRFIDTKLDCITCGACHSNSRTAGQRADALNPAALTRAAVLLADSRDAGGPERTAAARAMDDPERYDTWCPKGLDLAGALGELRRQSEEGE
jgi:succinate dehydrogenase / fumarate reductase iron-sulfur subunit/fumarate reductase iron-sulfur subunit